MALLPGGAPPSGGPFQALLERLAEEHGRVLAENASLKAGLGQSLSSSLRDSAAVLSLAPAPAGLAQPRPPEAAIVAAPSDSPVPLPPIIRGEARARSDSVLQQLRELRGVHWGGVSMAGHAPSELPQSVAAPAETGGTGTAAAALPPASPASATTAASSSPPPNKEAAASQQRRRGRELWARAREKALDKGKRAATPVSMASAMSERSMEVDSVWTNAGCRPKEKRLHGAATSEKLGLRLRETYLDRQAGLASFLQRFVLKPDDRKHLLWDVMSLLAVSYDIMATPLSVFELPDSLFSTAMAMATLIFWSTDILVTFFCGYHTVKGIEMRPAKIACHYLRTWFLLDFGTVLMEWLSVGGAGILRFGKVTRGIRLARMFRIVKIQSLFEELNDFIRSETALMAFQITRLVVFLLIINHFVACGWYAVGTVEGEFPHWTDRLPPGDLGFAYLTALHWALTQFTPASMEVHPTNLWERLYTICVMVMGLGAFSSFLGSISSLMTNLRQLQAAQHREDLMVRRYLMEHGVSFELGNHILFFFRESRKATKRRKLAEEDVKPFELLPDNLKIRLHWEVFEPIITMHPLFHFIVGEDQSGLVEISHRCMSEKLISKGQELFHYGKRAEKMCFIGSGALDYHPGRNGPVIEVTDSQWISEMVLWTQWVHQGSARAKNGICRMVCLSAALFHEHVQLQPDTFNICRLYAERYVQCVINGNSSGDLPQDVWGSCEEVQQVVREASDNLVEERKRLSKIVNLFSNGSGRKVFGKERRSSIVTRLRSSDFLQNRDSVSSCETVMRHCSLADPVAGEQPSQRDSTHSTSSIQAVRSVYSSLDQATWGSPRNSSGLLSLRGVEFNGQRSFCGTEVYSLPGSSQNLGTEHALWRKPVMA